MSKAYPISFINKIGPVIFDLLNTNLNNTNNDIVLTDSIDNNLTHIINVCLNFIGHYCYDKSLQVYELIEAHIFNNFVTRNANLYSVHADTLYLTKNINIFNGIIVVFNKIIENNFNHNDNKNKNINVTMFINVIKEIYLNQFKYINESDIIDNNDNMSKYYNQVKKFLMNKVIVDKIIEKLQ